MEQDPDEAVEHLISRGPKVFMGLEEELWVRKQAGARAGVKGGDVERAFLGEGGKSTWDSFPSRERFAASTTY